MKNSSFQKFTAWLVTACLVITMAPATAIADSDPPWEGAGTEGNPYLIEDADDLLALSNPANKAYWSAYFQQTDDITLPDPSAGDSNLAPIGTGSGWGGTTPFTGTYDGGGYSISNLTIYSSSLDYVGLFGYVGTENEDGTLNNITLEDVTIVSSGVQYGSAGSLVGSINPKGTVTNCRITGDSAVTGSGGSYAAVGGLAGRNYGAVSDCTSDSVAAGGNYTSVGGLTGINEGTVEGSESSGIVTGGYQSDAGGLIGYNCGTVENCTSNADVEAEGGDDLGTYTGGLIGYNLSNGSAAGCSATGSVSVTNRADAGGLVGYNYEGTITDCYSAGDVEGGRNAPAGGLVGQNGGTVENCQSTGDATGGDGVYLGGLSGNNWGTIANCYSAGNMAGGDNACVGGLVGENSNEIINCYSAGSVAAGDWAYVGGLVGKKTAGTIESSYYDSDVSGLRDDGGGIPQTTADMMLEETYTGWDFDDIWSITESVTYPWLQWQGAPTANESIRIAKTILVWNRIADENLTADAVTKDLQLPSDGFYGTTITWSSTDEDMVSLSGAVVRPPMAEGDKTVTLTAEISAAGGTSRQKAFELTVLAADDEDPGDDNPVDDNPRKSGGSSSPWYSAGISDGGSLPISVDTSAGSASVVLNTLAGSLAGIGNTLVTLPYISGVSAYTATLPASALSDGGAGSLTLDTSMGSITIPDNMLSGTGLTGSAGITIGQGNRDDLPDSANERIGDRPIIQLTLMINGQQTNWNNPNASVSISIPYKPTEEELSDPESIIIWYIDGSGSPVCVTNGRYDSLTGSVIFHTTHFSRYAVGYNPARFNDVSADAWYFKPVSFAAARNITEGTGNGSFSPDSKLKRGDALVLLMKACGIASSADLTDNFSDAGSTYYTDYLAAAKQLKISIGVGNNLFDPEKEISRQELFALLYNALKVIGALPQGDSAKTLLNFSDAGKIEPWAKDSIKLLVEAKIISGYGGKLFPADAITRAELMQVLYNLVK